MAIERQTSFAAGVLSPSLWGRTDLAAYMSGARTLENLVVSRSGSPDIRPGTQKVSEVLYYNADSGVAVVRKFVFSDTDALILVFSHHRIDVYSGTRYAFTREATVVTSYDAADLSTLNFFQDGNIVTISAPGYRMQELTRRANDDWLLQEASVAGQAFPYSSSTYVVDSSEYSTTPSAEAVRTTPHLRGATFTLPGSTAVAWDWVVTYVLRKANGELLETLGYKIAFYSSIQQPSGSNIYLLSDYGGTLIDTLPVFIWTPFDKLSSVPRNYTLVRTKVYRGREGLYGYVGSTESHFFVDRWDTPDYTDPPRTGLDNPLRYYDAGTTIDTLSTIVQYLMRPLVATYHQGRKYLAGLYDDSTAVAAGKEEQEDQAKILGSATDDYENYDKVQIPNDASPLSLSLRSNQHESIRALVPRERLLVLTASGEWVVGGSGQDELLLPSSIMARKISSYGSASVHPVEMAEHIAFVQAKGGTPRILIPNGGSYQCQDLSSRVRHLFHGYTIVDWDYAEDPNSILWVVRSDGKLLALTYLPGEEILAWTTHTITGGLVESVACIPEGTEDAVYMIVNRSGTRYLERLAYSTPLVGYDGRDDVRHAVHLDASVTYNGLGAADMQILDPGGDTTVGATVNAVFDTAFTGYTGRVVRVDDPAGGEPVYLLLGTENAAGDYDAQVIDQGPDIPAAMIATDLSSWWLCVDSVSGLEHLEGQTVKALVDGAVFDGLTVQAGAVGLGDGVNAGIVHVGLSFNADFESLDAVHERDRQKVIAELTLETRYRRGGFVGTSLDDLQEIEDRDVDQAFLNSSPEDYLSIPIAVPSSYDTKGRCAFRQSDPLPVTLLGLARKFEYGG